MLLHYCLVYCLAGHSRFLVGRSMFFFTWSVLAISYVRFLGHGHGLVLVSDLCSNGLNKCQMKSMNSKCSVYLMKLKCPDILTDI